MTVGHSLTWPNSRVLAGWWLQLDRHRPRALWLTHLLLHGVEAAVTLSRPAPQERLDRLLLQDLAASPSPIPDLSSRLNLAPPVLRRMLAELDRAGLAAADESGRWAPTATGRGVLEGPVPPVTRTERRLFYFKEGEDPYPGQRFLALQHPPAAPLHVEGEWSFDPQILRDCARRPEEWKRAHGFPSEVRDLAAPATGEVAPREAWQRVVVDRPEQLTVLLLLSVRDEAERLTGYAIYPGGWQLGAEEPVLELGPAWREVFPELTAEVGTEEWREIWRHWGQSRNLPPGELEACQLERSGVTLRVRAPGPLLERLRAARSDVFKGETWFLAGRGRTRAAAVLDVVEQ